MTTPAHALTMWIVEDTIRIAYPNGQVIDIPSFEPSRLVAILRNQVPREFKRALGWKDHFQASFGSPQEKQLHAEIKAKGQEIRKKEEERAAREKRTRVNRIAKRDKIKEAQEILDVVGLL